MRWLAAVLILLVLPAQASDMPGPYRADVLRVIDGDTLRVRAHIWLGHSVEVSVRVRGIDAPEIRGKCASERSLAAQAKSAAASLVGKRVLLRDVGPDKYAGRVVATVETATGDLAEALKSMRLARPYDGGKRTGWCG